MRRTVLTSIAAFTALAVAATPAMAMNSKQSLKASVSPNKAGTSKSPKNVALTVNPSVAFDPSDAPFATKTATIYLDKNLVFNTTKFKSCAAGVVLTNEASCAKGSKVGTGKASGLALGLTENLTVTGYNAPKGKGLNLLVVGSSPLTIRAVLESKLVKGSGAFGKKLIVPIPEGLQQPAPGAFATLTNFLTKISATTTVKGKKVGYVQLKGCPSSKKLKFKGDFGFTNGETQSPTTTAACRK